MTEATTPPPRILDAVVVGAGLTGLAYAWGLARQGRDVVVLEATARVGGHVRTEERDGFLVERGPVVVTGAARHVAALHRDLEGAPRLAAPPGGIAPLGLWGSRGVVSPPPRSRLAALRAAAHRLRRAPVVSRPTTLAAFGAGRGRQVVDPALLGPAARFHFGARPEEVGAADAWPQLVAAAAAPRRLVGRLASRRDAGHPLLVVRMLEGGMARLPRALADALGERVRLGVRVRAVEPVTPPSARGAARCVAVEGEDARTWRAREVALALPAAEQARLLRPLAPDVSELLAAALPVPLVQAAVALEGEMARRTCGAAGFLRGDRAPGHCLGAVFASTLDPGRAPARRALVQLWFGGTEAPDAVTWPRERLERIVAADLAHALGTSSAAHVLVLDRREHALCLPAPGRRARLARAEADLSDRGVRLLGDHVVGTDVDRRCALAAPLRSPLPEGTTGMGSRPGASRGC